MDREEPPLDPEDIYPSRPKISRRASLLLAFTLSVALWAVIIALAT